MKFSTKTALATLATATAGQGQMVSSPIALLESLQRLLSSSCQTAIGELLLAPNASLAQCVDVQGLVPVLMNNATSILPELNNYLTTICSSPACSNATLQNATSTILSQCSTDLSNFGISNDVVEIVFGAYSTVREVVCLSSNASDITTTLGNMTLPMNLTIPMTMNSTLMPLNTTLPPSPLPAPIPLVSPNATSPSSMTLPSSFNVTASNMTAFCPIALLADLESYLNQPLTNSFIDSLLLGGNSSAIRSLEAIITNTTILEELACNDCVAGAMDIILTNYPIINNLTISVPASYLTAANVSLPSSSNATSVSLSVPQIYEGVCKVDVGSLYNVSLPMSLNETAYNTTLPSFNTSSTPVNQTLARRMLRFAPDRI